MDKAPDSVDATQPRTENGNGSILRDNLAQRRQRIRAVKDGFRSFSEEQSSCWNSSARQQHIRCFHGYVATGRYLVAIVHAENIDDLSLQLDHLYAFDGCDFYDPREPGFQIHSEQWARCVTVFLLLKAGE